MYANISRRKRTVIFEAVSLQNVETMEIFDSFINSRFGRIAMIESAEVAQTQLCAF